MNKKVLVQFTNESWDKVDELFKKINEGFDAGRVTHSDLINEMILQASVDIQSIRMNHINLRKIARIWSKQKDLSINDIRKMISELESEPLKRDRSISGKRKEAGA